MTRRMFWALGLALIMAPGCAQRDVRDRVIQVSADDKEMNAAIARARATVGTFEAALRSPKPSQSRFSIKVKISDGDAHEHFWLSEVSYDGSLFRGRIDNDPETVNTVKIREAVSARPAEISDWMYVEGGTLVGGYTLRLLRHRLSPSDRAEFDKGIPFTVK